MKGKYFFVFFLIYCTSCNTNDYTIQQNSIQELKISQPKFLFQKDSAFSFIRKQVDFGPRVPNTIEHDITKEFLINTLNQFQLNTDKQEFVVLNYKNDSLNLTNIIAQFKPELQQRILLMTHWDTRPYADNDKVKLQNLLPDGANDGGSGTAILLEIARLLKLSKDDIDIGIDFIFFDGEEAGPPVNDKVYEQKLEYYCLGSQYFVKNNSFNIKTEMGVLLDIVGGKNAKFYFENISSDFAKKEMGQFWALAEKLNFKNNFIPEYKYFVGVDDHFYINKDLKIPSFAIIEYDSERNTFNKHQHKTSDNLSNIDKESLHKVGTVLWSFILNYKLINEK